jgi:uncharacterized protein (TIGR02246 family)
MEKNLIENGENATIEDMAAIRQLVENAERHQNDPDLFLALHSENVVIVNFAGRRVVGRDTLAKAMAKALNSSLAKVVTKNTIENISFIGLGVAIVTCIKEVSDERDSKDKNLNPLSSSKGALTYVVVKEDGTWKISLAQTTPIVIG